MDPASGSPLQCIQSKPLDASRNEIPGLSFVDPSTPDDLEVAWITFLVWISDSCASHLSTYLWTTSSQNIQHLLPNTLSNRAESESTTLGASSLSFN